MEDPDLKTPYADRVDFPADIKVYPVRHISELEQRQMTPTPAKSYHRPRQ